MTERLYYADAFRDSFDATVVAIDGTRVTLDRSAFYPTSGGQPFDLGTLGSARVVDVVDEGDAVVHVLEGQAPFAVGARVHGAIDWTRRFDHMQQHTGQHLLSAVFEDLLGAKTLSVHFGTESATLDLDIEAISRAEAARVEARANAVVAEDRPVTVSFEDAASAAGLRKASDRTGTLRIVSIADLDRSACGGTHVRATGQVGAILVRRLEKYKKQTRVEFVCGARAIRAARADHEALAAMAAALSAGIDELPALVASQREALLAAESRARKLAESLAAYRSREMYDAAPAGVGGLRRIAATAASVDELRLLASAITAMPAAVFVGRCDAPPTIVYAASDDSGRNAGAELKPVLAAHGGRGGGNSKVAQGSAPTPDALAAIAESLGR